MSDDETTRTPDRGRALLRRLRPLIVFYLSGVVVFGVFRFVFLLHNKGTIRKATTGEWLNCLRVGWLYDTAVLSHVLAPALVVLLLAPARWFAARAFRAVVATLSTILLSTFLMACVCDLFFFDHYADRLNYQVFSYPLFRLEVIAVIWEKYPLGWAGALAGVIGVACFTFFRRVGWSPAGTERLGDRVLAAAVLVPLAWWACGGPRGVSGSQRAALEASPAYISRQHVVNRAARNCVATLTRAFADLFVDNSLRPEEYGFVEPALARQAARQLILSPYDLPVTQPDNPLVRTTPARPLPPGQSPPNVVIVVMESLASQYVGSLGGPDAWTPELEELARRGVMFENFYAVGTRTSRGIVGTLSGFPDIPGVPIAERRQMRGPFLSLAEILKARGYRTLFVHGGNLKFNDIKRYIAAHGFETIVDRGDFDAYVEAQKRDPARFPTAFTTYWSVDDQSVFVRAHEMLRRERQPFFAVILTLTNHPTYEVPHDVFDRTVRPAQQGRFDVPAEMTEEERAVRYADWAVGDFFRRAEREPYFANTLFVLTGDHCRDQRAIWPVDAANFHIYGAMLGPERIVKTAPRAVLRDGAMRIPTIGSQADIAPTVLARLGVPFTHCFVGRDLFTTPPDEGFALLQQNGSIGFLCRRDKLVCITPDRPHPAIHGFRLLPDREQLEWGGGEIEADTRELAELHRLGSGLFQTAAEIFQAGEHCVRH